MRPPAGVASEEVDVLVIGSGAGGLSAAVTAASGGLRVMVVDKADRFGGTTAWSGGWMWIPGSPLLPAPERQAEVDSARAYLGEHMGDAFGLHQTKVDTYLKNGPQMLAFFRAPGGPRRFEPFQFDLDSSTPDFHASVFAQTGRRAVRASAIDSALLGDEAYRLREPLHELTVFGIGIESGDDLASVLRAHRWPLCYRAVRRLCALFDERLGFRLTPPRRLQVGAGQRLVNGHALAARLLRAAREVGVDLRASTTAYQLTTDLQGVVIGARLGSAQGLLTVRARHGVVLACGGFAHDAERLRALVPQGGPKQSFPSAAPQTNRGEGLRMGESVGALVKPIAVQPNERGAAAAFDPKRPAPALWAPVSLLRRRDGSTAVYPHFVERAKPGVIAVGRAGKRFCNEASPYHDFVAAWLQATPQGTPLEAWLVCDRVFLWRYGLGAVKPALPWRTRLWTRPFRTGYVQRAGTLEGLAQACGIDASTLRRTVETHNADARSPSGRDTQFGRGASDYDKSQGDPLRPRKPCMAPIESAPFFAVQLQPGSLGTFAGLETSVNGEVLRESDGRPIPGLYACGNDMAAPLGGFYPSSGFTLGAAMTFGWRIGAALAPAGTQPTAVVPATP